MTTVDRGLYVGRFQPFHLGHLAAIETGLKEFPEIIVGIAAIEENLSWSNPFSCAERMEMIWGSLPRSYRSRCLMVPIPDNRNNILWLDYLRQYIPRFSAALTNNPLQAMIMRQAGIAVKPVPFTRRHDFQGSVIRELLASHDSRWEKLVPEDGKNILKSVAAEERLATLKEMG